MNELTNLNLNNKKIEEVINYDKDIVSRIVNLEYINVNDNKMYLYFKRVLDILLSLIGLVVLSPLLIIVAAIIKIEDPKGSIFFVQERIGQNGNKFKMYKFRSMVLNAESQLEHLIADNEINGAMFKLKQDPRVTKIGKVIRSTSIDELPQLINVIKGEMTLVGPRPPLEREVMMYDNRDLIRLIVKPGCTGLWQATVRNSVGFKEMVELDIFYIENRTLFYDMKIILLTVRSLFVSRAY